MNCDTAFDLMTDANGSRSSALARHFATCSRCRQMQETLAPALEFLMQDEPSQPDFAVSGDSATREAEQRQPVVTIESLKMAHQAAGRLTAQAELPRARRQRLAGQATRYAAVFAAGVLLALAIVPQREPATMPAGQCTRQNAGGGPPAGRSADAMQDLTRACAVCHTTAPAAAHENQTSFRSGFHSGFSSERADSWDWLVPFFEEEIGLRNFHGGGDESRYVAGFKRVDTDSNAVCRRVQHSSLGSEATA